ncbi:hypothetical protein HYE68_000207 [Fusarium pseudograminearum]|nr:hypothetical protein HYE68_000207 [Fusarium pseudograminearum]
MDVKLLNDELTALLSRHFQIVATHSQRQDQWYKRSYQSFTSQHGDRRLLILVPYTSREEWIPHVRRFASSLGKKLEIPGRESRAVKNISESKLFLDHVLDEAHARALCLAITDSKPLSPDMMQMSWWTTKVQHPGDKARRLKGIKALIACGQVDSLIRLASWPHVYPEQVSHIKPYQWTSLNNGWQASIDNIIVIMLFLGITGSFTEDFVEKDGYKYWAPVALFTYKSPLTAYIEAFDGKLPAGNSERQQQMTHCLEALAAAQSWALSTDSTINWGERIMDNFLYMLGFEAWNRSREGEGYLGCDLNKTKTAKSLQGLGQDEEYISTKSDEGSTKKRIDPLNLRDPKKEILPEPTDEEKQEMEELSVLESIEAEYGRKRSTKYINKNR